MSKYTDIMIDFETLDVRPSSVVLSMGAVKFNLDNGEIDEQGIFYTEFSLTEQLSKGRTISADTLQWWIRQHSKGAFMPIFGDCFMKSVLGKFGGWLGKWDYRVWSNGADFDIPILVSLYGMCDFHYPFKHYNHRCYRTTVAGKPRPVGKTTHRADEDALSQVKHLLEVK